jgi:CMP-N-acetylneuraminic acid synthetase
MISDKRILIVIPARGGSKGIRLKNTRKVFGVPLVARAINIAKSITEVDRIIVSTDHEDIAKISLDNGINMPFMRPKELSGDCISDWEVLEHVLTKCETLDNLQYDIIVMLQPTSPLRKKTHVLRSINNLINNDYDSVWTLSATDSKYHPLKQLIINKNDCLQLYDRKGLSIIARQQLNNVYHRNGIAYVFTRECILKQKTILGKNSGYLILEGEYISIDTEKDIENAERLMHKN